MARRIPILDLRYHFVDGIAHLIMRIDMEFIGFQTLQQRCLRVNIRPFGLANSISEEIQVSRCRYGRIELTQGTGCSVSRIHKGRFPRFVAFFVDTFKFLVRHIRFAANFNVRRRIVDDERHRTNGSHISRYIFAHTAVTASNGAHKDAIFVVNINGQTINLKLYYVLRCVT